MRIIELVAQDYGILKAVRFRPGPFGNEIVGANAAGKSTVLDCVFVALSGKKVDREQPIRQGANSAQVSLDLGTIRVRRTWTKDGASYLAVEDINGNPKRAPQSLLDGLASSLGMDPLVFARSSPKDQVETLLRTFGVKVDDLDEMADGVTEARKERNREAKQLRAAAAAIHVNTKLTTIPLDLEDLKNQRAAARAELLRIETLIDQAQTCQAEVERARQKEEYEDHANYTEYEASQMTLQLDEIRKAKQIRLDQVGSNVPGLTVEEGQVLYAGLPLSQASTARQIRIGLEVAAAASPALRLLMIRDGSLLDSDMLSEIHEFAEQKDLQILIEKVGNEAPEHHGLLIVDGEAVAKNEMPYDPSRIVKQTTHELIKEQEAFF